MSRRPPGSTPFPYTTLFRSDPLGPADPAALDRRRPHLPGREAGPGPVRAAPGSGRRRGPPRRAPQLRGPDPRVRGGRVGVGPLWAGGVLRIDRLGAASTGGRRMRTVSRRPGRLGASPRAAHPAEIGRAHVWTPATVKSPI